MGCECVCVCVCVCGCVCVGVSGCVGCNVCVAYPTWHTLVSFLRHMFLCA